MKQLKLRQVCLFLIAFVPVTKIFLLPSVLSALSNEDLWISATVVFLFEALTIAVLLFVSFNTHSDYYSLLKMNFNDIIAKAVYFVYGIYFVIKSLLPIIEQKGFVELTLYETTPTVLTFFPFFIISFYLSTKYLRTIGRLSDIFFAITLIGMAIVFLLAFKNADLFSILPVGANGFSNTIKGSYMGISYFGDAVYLLFFMGEYQKEKKGYLKVLLSYLIASATVLLFLIIFYCTFTATSLRQLFALSELAKYKNVINNTGRFDYLSTFLLLTSSVFAVSLPLYFATTCFKKAFGLLNNMIPAIIVNGAVFIFLTVFSKSYVEIENFVKNYMGVFFIIMGNAIPILTVFLRRKYEKA